MKSVNGMILMVIGVFLLWIGVTGRFPKLMEAIGVFRGSNPNQSNSKSTAQMSGSTPSTSTESAIGLTPKGQAILDSLNRPQSQVWADALSSLKNPDKGASISW